GRTVTGVQTCALPIWPRRRPGPGAARGTMTGRILTIPVGQGVADALARGLLAQAAGDPLALGAMTVLLPTRRAGATLRGAFLRRAGGRRVGEAAAPRP